MRRSAAMEEAVKAAATHRRWVVKQEENSALLEAGVPSSEGTANPLPQLEVSLRRGAGLGQAAPATVRQVLFAVPPFGGPGPGREAVPPSYAAAVQHATSLLGLQLHLDGLGEDRPALLASAASWATMMGGVGPGSQGLITSQADAEALMRQVLSAPSAAVRGAACAMLTGDTSNGIHADSAYRTCCPLSDAPDPSASRPPAFQLPSLQELMVTLEATGYHFDRKMGASSDGPTARQSDDSGEDSPSELQVYTVKLLLRLAGHVAQQRSMGQRQDCGAVPAGDLVPWIQACCALLVDAAAPALGGAINAALPLFLEAFSEAEWAEHAGASLRGLAGRLVHHAPSPQACLDMLRLLPFTPRGQRLRLHVGGALLGSLVPGHAAAAPVTATSTASSVVCLQPWFASPRQLVGQATSGDAIPQGPNEYGMHTLELLLATCDLLLWPDLIRGDLPGQALSRWLNFLIGIQRSIRAMVPEDQAVKVLATHLELEYRAHSGAIG